MIKVEVIEKFTLSDYKKLKNIEKVMVRKENEFGVGDTFECNEEMAKYLTGNNALKKEVVKVVEIKHEKEKPIKLDEEDTKIIADTLNKEIKKGTKKKKGNKKKEEK